ncbi:hypothetical protein JQR88_25725 (plasmid) [Pseudomonas luteola]|uniref:hypothetical protein n=1 Tax=Pseudomonas luteola TaxID=47886 RepID=UPI003DA0DFC0
MISQLFIPAHYSEAIVRFIRQDLIDDQDIEALPIMDIAFTGVDDLDERSGYSVQRSKKLGNQHFVVRYDPKSFTLDVGGRSFRANDGGLEDLALHFVADSIVIDATTLDFAEIALLLYAYMFSRKRPRIGFLYVEPERYVKRELEDAAVRGAEFALSEGFTTQSIPPFSAMLNPQDRVHLVAFLGFEGGRLARAITQDDGHFMKKYSVVFGIPPFQASWDLEALMANSRLLSNQDITVKFCSANNPKAAYELLAETLEATTAYSVCNRLMVSPFGTKPMAIGAALFCATERRPRVLFDHPQRKKGRTVGVHCIHWYEVDLT